MHRKGIFLSDNEENMRYFSARLEMKPVIFKLMLLKAKSHAIVQNSSGKVTKAALLIYIFLILVF